MSKQIIGLIDYGAAGNIHSVAKALVKAGATVQIVQNEQNLNQVDKVILPGVGSFVDGMKELTQKELINPLIEALKQKPSLGICLGMQILAQIGYEFQKTTGLGLFDAEVIEIKSELPTPHMGFNCLEVQQPNILLEGVESELFYFMHSFEVVNYTDILALTKYGKHQFVSALMRESLFGVQFHPEKSRDAGIQVFKNFIRI